MQKNKPPHLATIGLKTIEINDQQPLKIERITLPSNHSLFPTKLGFMCFVIVEEGNFSIGINLRNYSASPGCLIAIPPEKAITYYESSSQVKIRIMAINPKLLAFMLPEFTEALPALMKTDIKQVYSLSADRLKDINSWFDFLEMQTLEPSSPGNYKVIKHLISAFHLHLLNIIFANKDEKQSKRSRKEDLMTQFLITLGKYCKQERSVNFYASQLCVSAKHLSSVIKDVSGDTATKFINRHVIIEAQILLKSSSYTIQQIATELNFPNQSFFGKYFKKITGMSPNAYRHSIYE